MKKRQGEDKTRQGKARHLRTGEERQDKAKYVTEMGKVKGGRRAHDLSNMNQ
jgi:hypothetical protein